MYCSRLKSKSIAALFRQAEQTLGDDVALNLRRARVNRERLRAQEAHLKTAVARRQRIAAIEGRQWAQHLKRSLVESLHGVAPIEFVHRRVRASRRAFQRP